MSLRFKIIFVLIPVLVLAGLAWWKMRGDPGSSSGGGARQSASAPAVRTYTVEQRPFESTLVFNGSLVPYDRIDVRSELSGRVREIHFSDGEVVEAGDPLIEIDTDELEAELRSLREQLELARINAERLERLYASNSVTARERDEGVSQREVLRAEVDRLEARLRKGRIVAPFAGTLGLRYVSPGDLLDPSTLITTLQTVDRLRLDFSVPERFLPSIERGMAVSFTVAGHAEEFTGEVSALDPSVDRNTRSLLVRADVVNEERVLIPGNYARVELILSRENAVVVPAIAVVRTLDAVSVFRVEDGQAVRTEIEVGERTPESVEVTAGLQAGDVVVTDGVQGVRDGQALNIQSSDNE